MFGRRPSQSHSRSESFSTKYRAGKAASRSRKSFRGGEPPVILKRSERGQKPESPVPKYAPPINPLSSIHDPVANVSRSVASLTSAIVTLCVGPEQRLFAAHEEILSVSPFFSSCCRGQFLESGNKQINLPSEQPEILSSILEYLYKGDYFPRLVHNKRRNTWELEAAVDENGAPVLAESTVIDPIDGSVVLKDTAIYCAADRYGLSELKRLALRKQGLQSAIQCSTILSSARYAYAHTPDTDSKLRAHYLALIIRSRSTFKRSGTMQMEMETGGKLFFDLFVAMCNHMDDITGPSKSPFSR
ncbi:conserved hypothetical protein [Uncinocarpus reesii 1704]|uniref:BTB domain-containing protein n=1 Tax=Uncinocarpus reesii (strain UAMH 1704) TaxID=336963 RepID=C4JVN0_UNCRE|nr:uncharacterized protein UREG_06622 [Uncinocarpus reesii 1704]EEP81757.1 conserved hypothetical protein [Uncinocarpus reesii 1704]